MTDSRRALDLFDQYAVLDPAARDAWLDQMCGGNTALRYEVEQLFEADQRANDFLAAPLVESESRDGERVGERVGAWKLEKLIGMGGMGSVYRATRADGAYEKFVAIKFLLFDAGDLRRRFALEQRILGALTHPNIAALLDVGIDARGGPFLVMEYVDGEPITDYVKHRALDLRARVELFCDILDAMQTAHSQLVVHRDIKPSNVLVDSHGVPKLLDFGIAKLIDDRAGKQTLTGLGPLTPDYASPEQVRGAPIGTPSDIYSLGVLLYEIATDEKPYDIDDRSPSAIERIVCNTDPARPSARVALHTDGRNARDLDAVILKAMEKQPTRRYSSCAEFAADLQRWLDGNAVVAREPTQREKVLRYLHRHRLGVSVAAAIALSLIAGLAATFWEALVAREQTRIARVERDHAQSAIHFLTDTLSAASPENLGRNVTVLDVLHQARDNAQKQLDDHSDIYATVQETLAETYRAVGDMQTARECAEEAVRAARAHGDASMIIDTELALGYILRENGDLEPAQKILESVREHAVANGSQEQRAMSAEMLGGLANTRNDLTAGQHWFEVALKETPVDNIGARAEIMNGLAIAKNQAGDKRGAIELHRKALDALLAANDKNNPRLAKTWINLANALDDVDDVKGAAEAFDKGLAMQIALDGESHPDVVNTLSSITMFDVDHGNIERALDDGARAVADAQNLPQKNLQAPYARYSYGRALLLANRPRDAVAQLEAAFVARVAIYSPQHPQTLITQSWLGLAHALAGDKPRGLEQTRDAYTQLRDKLGDDHSMTKRARANLERVESLTANGAR